MITEHDLQEAIAECEGQRNPTASTCLKLAAFYTIKDKMYPAKQENEIMTPQSQYSYSNRSIVSEIGDTEFRQAAYSMDEEELLSVMDELMTTLKAIMPRLYDGVMRKLKN